MADASTSSATAAKTTAAALTKSGVSQRKLIKDLDQFMTLLVTQLKHQDPLDPMDPNEFTSQLVQFAGVEQQIQGNKNLEDMLTLQKSNMLGTVVGYIGRQVEINGNTLTLNNNGFAHADYTLLSSAESSTITVKNSKDRVVYFTEGKTTAGKHAFEWDGTDNFGFPVRADDTYKIEVSAKDAKGKPVDVEYTVTGMVTSVDIDKGVAILSVGSEKFNAEDVISVGPTQFVQPVQLMRPVRELAAEAEAQAEAEARAQARAEELAAEAEE